MQLNQDIGDPNLADLVNNLLASDHAKAVASHPDFPVAVASLREDLTKRLQEVLGRGTGVKEGMDASKTDKAAEEQSKNAPPPKAPDAVVEAMKDTNNWARAYSQAVKIYSGDSPEERAQAQAAALRLYNIDTGK